MNIIREFVKNHAHPKGFLGWLAALHMARENREANRWTIALLDIQPTDRVLEAGFGPGLAIQAIAKIVTAGQVAGVDSSETMVALARRRNAAAIATGRVDLRHGDISTLLHADDSFDKILAINVIYFLPDPIASLRELWRVTKPGGRIALFWVAKQVIVSRPFVDGIYTLYTPEQVAQHLHQAGFARSRVESRAFKWGAGLCALAEK